jgi:clan AA aspartic protease (TIGR02281 family)
MPGERRVIIEQDDDFMSQVAKVLSGQPVASAPLTGRQTIRLSTADMARLRQQFPDVDFGTNITDPRVLDAVQHMVAAGRATATAATTAPSAMQNTPKSAATSGSTADGPFIVRPDRAGKYFLDADIGGVVLHMQWDTGADTVALTYEDGQRIGFNPTARDWNQPVGSANGTGMCARVQLSSMTIQGVTMQAVEALIMQPRTLVNSVIGRSWWGRLPQGFTFVREGQETGLREDTSMNTADTAPATQAVRQFVDQMPDFISKLGQLAGIPQADTQQVIDRAKSGNFTAQDAKQLVDQMLSAQHLTMPPDARRLLDRMLKNAGIQQPVREGGAVTALPPTRRVLRVPAADLS